MADSNPTLYASSFSESRSPPSTFRPTSLRLSLHRSLTQDLSTYFHERSRIEAEYIQALEKLSSRLHSSSAKESVFSESDSFGLDPREKGQQLGEGLVKVQKTLEEEVKQLGRSHQNWRKKVSEQVEAPLRESLNGGEWGKWDREEKRLGGDVKEYENLVEKLSKARTKSSKSNSKLLSTQSSLSTLGSSLTSSLPSFLTQSQSLELSQTQLLKQLLVLYGTFSTDLARDRMELGENLVQTVLGLEEGVEMQEWALREGDKASAGNGRGLETLEEFGGQRERQREESAATTTTTTAETDSIAPSVNTTRNDQLYPNAATNSSGYQRERTSSRLSTAPPVAPLPLPTSASEDTRSITSSTTTPSKPKSKLGSKLSSFLGGGKKDKSSSSSSFDKQSSRDRSSSIPNSARYASFTETPPAIPSPSLQAPPPMERNLSNRSNGSDLLGGPSGGEGNGSFQTPLQPTPAGSTHNKRETSLFPTLGGGSSSGGGLFRRQSRMNSMNSVNNNNNNNNAQPSSKNETTTTMNGYGNGVPFVAEPNEIGTGGMGVDEEGFSVPPKGYDRAIGTDSTAGGLGSGTRNLMDDDEEEEDTDQRQNVPKLNILPVSSSSPKIPSLPASPVISQESESERLAALSAIKNSLGAPPSSSASIAGGLNRRATARGRRSEATALATGGGVTTNRPHSMLPSATTSASIAGLQRRETDDDNVPLAMIQHQQQQQQETAAKRRAAPPPPPSSAPAPSGSTPSSLTSSPTSTTFPTAVPVPIASSLNNPSRTMSILSTNSSLAASASGIGSSALARRDPFEGVTEPGLRISILEQINVLMKNGEVQKVLVTGEIGVSYRPDNSTSSSSEEKERDMELKITNFDQLEKTAPNSTYLSSTLIPGSFKLSTPSLASKQGTTVPVLKYQLRTPSTSTAGLKDLVPLIVRPTWRCEPNLTRIIVVYSQNPSFSTYPSSSSSSSSSSPFGDDEPGPGIGIEYEELSLEIPFKQGQIDSFQSKPPSIGSSSPNGSLIFALPTGSISKEGKEEKLLVSAQTQGNEAARVGNMSLKWRIEGKSIGRVGVEVIGGGKGEGEGVREVRREIESGKYIIA